MICYKDMTFCAYYKSCKHGKTCHRALTDKVKDGALKAFLGISVFSVKPDCYEEEK